MSRAAQFVLATDLIELRRERRKGPLLIVQLVAKFVMLCFCGLNFDLGSLPQFGKIAGAVG